MLAHYRFNHASYDDFSRSDCMTIRRRRFTLDTAKFNALSVAIISFASLYASTAYAQLTAPSSAAAGTGLAAPAAAGPVASAEDARYLEAFARADKDADGKLNKTEAENLPAIAQRFDLIDADKDANLSQEEYLNALKP
jgi:hypothetical protein